MQSLLSRRTMMKSVLAATGSAVSQQAVGRTNATTSDWPQYRHDAVNSGTVSKKNEPSGPLEERWSFETSGELSPGPLIANGTVYVGSSNGTAYALAANDGSERWRTTAGKGIAAPTATGDSAVYVRTKRSPAVALDTETGTERWRLDVSETTYSQPTFAEGIVYVGGPRGTVYALDADSGERKWSFDTKTGLVGVPAVTDETVYVTGNGGLLLALDANYGSKQWHYQQSQTISAPPTVVEKHLFVADGDRVLAFHADTGSPLWGRRIYQAGAFGVAVAGDRVYVTGATEYDKPVNRLNALAVEDGTSVWQTDLPANPTTAPTVVGDTVLVGCKDGNLYALDRGSGTKTWHVAVGGTDVFAPAVVNETVYVGSQYGLHAFEGGMPPWMPFAALAGAVGVGGFVTYLFRKRFR